MKHAYLVLASERRVLNVVFDDAADAIHRAIGCRSVEHGTTFHTEDQHLITGDELGGVSQDQFWVAGVPFPFHWNAMLVGIDPLTGNTASRPIMAIDEFQRMIRFAVASDVGRATATEPTTCDRA